MNMVFLDFVKQKKDFENTRFFSPVFEKKLRLNNLRALINYEIFIN